MYSEGLRTPFQQALVNNSDANSLFSAAKEWKPIDVVVTDAGKTVILIKNETTDKTLEAGRVRMSQVSVSGTPLEGAYKMADVAKKLFAGVDVSPGCAFAEMAFRNLWIDGVDQEFAISMHGRSKLTMRQLERRRVVNRQIAEKTPHNHAGPAQGIQRVTRLKHGSLDAIRQNLHGFVPKNALMLAVQNSLIPAKSVGFYNAMRGKADMSSKQKEYVAGLNSTMLRKAHLIEAS